MTKLGEPQRQLIVEAVLNYPALRAENQRLREALERIANYNYQGQESMPDIARAALKETEHGRD